MIVGMIAPFALDPGHEGLLGSQLLHRYFVQVAEDGKHLVPGVLHQGLRPTNGNWLEVGNITRSLPKRYFVKMNPNRTLLPGMLITADKHPGDWWKEL